MDLVVVHIFLLLIQCSDRQIQTCFFFCCCISVTHELFQIPYVPCNITKLFSQGFPYFLCTVFFASGKCQIIFSGAFFVTSRRWQIIGLTKTADDRHPYGQADIHLLPSAFQKKYVYGRGPVCLHQTVPALDSPVVR